MGVSSPASASSPRQRRQIGRYGLSCISQPSTYGVTSSRNAVSMRMSRVLAWPRRPSRMKLWRDRMAFTTCGTTVSSNPMMPGNSGSPRWILQIRLPRSSSLTDRLASLASEKELWRSVPRVRGNSGVARDKQIPPLSAIVADQTMPARPIRYNGCFGDKGTNPTRWRMAPFLGHDPRCTAWIHCGVDGEHHPAALCHHHAGSGLRDPQRFYGEFVVDRRPRTGRQAGIRAVGTGDEAPGALP